MPNLYVRERWWGSSRRGRKEAKNAEDAEKIGKKKICVENCLYEVLNIGSVYIYCVAIRINNIIISDRNSIRLA